MLVLAQCLAIIVLIKDVLVLGVSIYATFFKRDFPLKTLPFKFPIFC